MITCRDFAELVTSFLEGTLGLSESAQMRVHAAICRNCHAYLGQMRAVVELAGETGTDAPAPEGVKSALRERLRRKSQHD